MDDVYKYEDYLKTSIVVISANMGNESIYSGSARYKNQIFIYHSGKIGEGHFDVITKPNALLCKSYFCTGCKKAFNNRTSHKCKDWCNICGRENCKVQEDRMVV